VTTVELRNESSVRGRIDSVDYLMNMTLTDAVVVAPDGRQLMKCEQFFVQVSDMLLTLRSRFNCLDKASDVMNVFLSKILTVPSLLRHNQSRPLSLRYEPSFGMQSHSCCQIS